MTALRDAVGHDTAAVPLEQCGARAYCGPAHGRAWQVNAHRPPPWTVDLHVDGQPIAVYRLVLRPRSRHPMRNQLGEFLYVPMQYDLSLVDPDHASASTQSPA